MTTPLSNCILANVETIFEFHEATGNPATFVTERAPGFEDEDIAPIINMAIVLTGTPTQMAVVKAMIAGVML